MGGGGVQNGLKNADVINEQPLIETVMTQYPGIIETVLTEYPGIKETLLTQYQGEGSGKTQERVAWICCTL